MRSRWNMPLVFVYGTLRRGEVNHHLLIDAEYVGGHVTPPIYKMLNLGTYPGVVAGGSSFVVGDIYRVNQVQFNKLDRLENYPSLYTRKLISTESEKAWIYLYGGKRENRPVIPSGDWLAAGKRQGTFSLY